MNQTHVTLRIAEWAQAGGAIPLNEALAALATVIDHLDMDSDTYEADRTALLSVGASLWELSRQRGGQEPQWVPPSLRSGKS